MPKVGIGLMVSVWVAWAAPALGIERVAPKTAAAQVTAGQAVLVDVREASELRAEGSAAPATWLAKSSVDGTDTAFKAFLKAHDKKRPLYFYCGSGRRAEAVAKQFEALGYHVGNVGSFDDWKEAGLPVKAVPVPK